MLVVIFTRSLESAFAFKTPQERAELLLMVLSMNDMVVLGLLACITPPLPCKAALLMNVLWLIVIHLRTVCGPNRCKIAPPFPLIAVLFMNTDRMTNSEFSYPPPTSNAPPPTVPVTVLLIRLTFISVSVLM